MKLVLLAVAAMALGAHGMCPGDCSGHGHCGEYDACDCYDNWEGPDCGSRKCAETLSWIDVDHGYAVCGDAGSCDASTGICQCQDGYTGEGCDRTVCFPQDCNNHGRCVTIEGDLWSAGKQTYCECDPGFEGIGCQYRVCPKGDDPLTPSSVQFETQTIGYTSTQSAFSYTCNDDVANNYKAYEKEIMVYYKQTEAVSSMDYFYPPGSEANDEDVVFFLGGGDGEYDLPEHVPIVEGEHWDNLNSYGYSGLSSQLYTANVGPRFSTKVFAASVEGGTSDGFASCSYWDSGTFTDLRPEVQFGLSGSVIPLKAEALDHFDNGAPLGMPGQLCIAVRDSAGDGWDGETISVFDFTGTEIFTAEGTGTDSTSDWIFDETTCVDYNPPALAPTGEFYLSFDDYVFGEVNSHKLSTSEMTALTIKEAIESMPNNVIPEVNVTLSAEAVISVTFADKRNIGQQPLLTVMPTACTQDGCQPYTAGMTLTTTSGIEGTQYFTTAGSVDALAEFDECSNRGICDRNAGRCQCEPGYHGQACDSQNEIH